MAKNLPVAAALALAAALAGQQPKLELRVPYWPQGIQVDGDLSEWGADHSHGVLPVQHSWQVWDQQNRGAWGGPEDLSAEFYLCYDSAHLYVAGTVHDQSLVPPRPGERWNVGDVVELFFDFRPRDTAGQPLPAPEQQTRPLGPAQPQVFLMPLNTGRRWGVVEWKESLTRPTGEDLTGILVAGRETSEGYVFEARLPFHNFFAPEDGPSFQRIDFNLALDDFDTGTERYQYMTWTGTNPTQDPDHGTLVFDGPGPLAHAADGGLAGSEVLWSAAYLLAGGMLLVLLVLALRRASATQVRPLYQRLLRVAGVVLLVAGALLPGLFGSWRQQGVDARLDRAAGMLAAELPKMERGTLGGYLGGQRDRPLLDLLLGRTIERRRFASHVLLSDLVPGQFGPGPVPYPRGFFDVRPYWIPLPPEQQQWFAFPEPLDGRKLNIVVARAASPRPTGSGFQLELAFRLQGDDPGSTRFVDEFGEAVPADALGKPGRLMAYATVELPGPVRSLGIKALEDDDLTLVGLTVVPDEPGQSMLPLNLGQPSINGVPTDLRDRYPEDAGIELRRQGSTARVEIPELPNSQRGFDRMWLFYRAIDPGFLVKTQKGQEVCRVTARFADDLHPRQVVTLRHQESVLYERLDANQEKGPAAGTPARIAFRWREEDQAQRINLVYEVELADGARLQSLEFENLGPYPVRFRSVVFGTDEPGARLDPNDSPLEPDSGRVRLKPQHLRQVQGVDFAIYRNRYLSASASVSSSASASVSSSASASVSSSASASVSSSVGVDGNDKMRLTIPLAVQKRLGSTESATQRLWKGDTLILERFLPLTGEGWAGAVLGMRVKDEGGGAYQRRLSLVGLCLVLLSTPLLLLLFSDVLAFISNLRLRLMLVVSVATLVPLGVVFVFLVGVLETGHANELRQTMQQAAAAARSQLQERSAELRSTAGTWLLDLERDYQRLTSHGDLARLRDALSSALDNQLPPDWDGGFLRLDYHPERAQGESAVPAFSVFAGDEALRHPGVPMRPTPGLRLAWGRPLIGVRCERGPLSLTVGRPLDERLLRDVSPGLGAVLCDAKGYPLTTAIADQQLQAMAAAPGMMSARAEAALAVHETGNADLRVHGAAGQEWLGIYDVVRDAEGTPRAILGLLDRNRAPTLELGLGPVPVRSFFWGVAAILLVLALVLASVVTTRITRPIEELEEGAEALRRGQLDVRVAEQEGGQLGRLTHAFNQMAQDLRSRILDLHHLNRGIRHLTRGLDLEQVVQSVIAIFRRHSPADQVRVLLLDRERDRVEILGQERQVVDHGAPDIAAVMRATGPTSLQLSEDRRGLAALFPACRSLLALPLVLAGQVRGSILLLFESSSPGAVNLELLTTLAAQTVTAVDNARLYRHAVQDLYTGAYVKEYFRRRVVQAVEEAHREGHTLTLIGLRVLHPCVQDLGAEGYGRFLGRFCGVLRRQLPEAVLSRSGEDTFQALLVGAAPEDVAMGLEGLGRALAAAGLGSSGTPRVQHARVTFPADGASAEFLFHALETRLRSPEPEPERGQEEPLGWDPALAVAAEEGLVLTSPRIQGVVRLLSKVAPAELTILLLGETGTGKEVLANLIHKWSKRARGPLVRVHCAALTESLLQSELFGHEKGAFTGAVARKIGRFEQAQGGTLFLDEIGEISPDTQVKLLRVLQEREIDRVGGLAPVQVDVRVIAATNQDIRAMVAQGTFREDLYYRLQGMVVTVPPLRERKQEIPGLVESFRKEAVAQGHSRVTGFSTDAMDELFGRDWPGNIRELRNTVFRAMILAAEGEVQREHLLGNFTASDRAGSRDQAPRNRKEEQPVVVLPRPELDARVHALRGRLQRLYQLVRDRGTLAAQDYVDATGVSARTGLRDLGQLLELGLIERVGKRRGARYRLARVGEIPDTRRDQPGEKV